MSEKPAEKPYRPVLILLTANWITMLGSALVVLAAVALLFLIPVQMAGQVSNPYSGLLAFLIVPAVLLVGLLLIPLGWFVAKRSGVTMMAGVTDRRAAWRKAILFFGVVTALNVLVGGQLTYRAVEHMDTQQFCGQTCHAMTPQFTSHTRPPHLRVACVSCHVSPGATGYLKAKTAGTRRLVGAVMNNFERPVDYIPGQEGSASSSETCEVCHARETTLGPRFRILPKFADDEANTRSETVLMMRVGGGASGGIHGAHLAPGVSIRYFATDNKRQTIPRVEYRNAKAGINRTFINKSAGSNTQNLRAFVMQCADCHNRVAHSFELPEQAVDRALASGEVSPSLPFAKKTAVQILMAKYADVDEAGRKIPTAFEAFYRQNYPQVLAAQGAAITRSGSALLAIYRHNVFPDLKVTWGTYPTNLGHMTSPGCFRCHDGDHTSEDGKTASQDCETCHRTLAVEEKDPAVLKDLGISTALR